MLKMGKRSLWTKTGIQECVLVFLFREIYYFRVYLLNLPKMM